MVHVLDIVHLRHGVLEVRGAARAENVHRTLRASGLLGARELLHHNWRHGLLRRHGGLGSGVLQLVEELAGARNRKMVREERVHWAVRVHRVERGVDHRGRRERVLGELCLRETARLHRQRNTGHHAEALEGVVAAGHDHHHVHCLRERIQVRLELAVVQLAKVGDARSHALHHAHEHHRMRIQRHRAHCALAAHCIHHVHGAAEALDKVAVKQAVGHVVGRLGERAESLAALAAALAGLAGLAALAGLAGLLSAAVVVLVLVAVLVVVLELACLGERSFNVVEVDLAHQIVFVVNKVEIKVVCRVDFGGGLGGCKHQQCAERKQTRKQNLHFFLLRGVCVWNVQKFRLV
eukprot:comp15406_c0_seq1/m.23392 comp15406_c0_seq1/g.23392  ORF comp15406_c0_seq1/g.23392 comp15406_c0_seq1/m.23392 type:complete len:350 (-) comp15406_c0_seq1:67-1116(-)